MGPSVIIAQTPHWLPRRSSQFFLFQDQKTVTACLNQMLCEKILFLNQEYFFLNVLKTDYDNGFC